MSDSTDSKLEQVYELIRQEKLDEAIAILQPVLLNEPENADAWWLWANTVTEPEDARQALQKVLQYNPDHQAALQMSEHLDELYPPVPEAELDSFELGEASDFENLYGDTDLQQSLEPDIPDILPPEVETKPGDEQDIAPIKPLTSDAKTSDQADSAVDFGDLFDVADDEKADLDDEKAVLDTEADKEDSHQKSSPVLRIALIASLIILVGLAVILVFDIGDKATPQAAQQLPETVQAVIPQIETAANEQAESLGGPSTIQYEMINGEPAILLLVCRTAGPDISTAMTAAMDIITAESASLQNEVTFIGVRLMNCDLNDGLMSAYTDMDQANAYTQSEITQSEYRASWQWED